jgi:hypothetical protein
MASRADGEENGKLYTEIPLKKDSNRLQTTQSKNYCLPAT